MKPIIKWIGGKSQLVNELKEIITPELLEGHTYYEPFFGGGALAFDLEHPNTVVNDLNSELINMYTVIRDEPMTLIAVLKLHQVRHNEEWYYQVRNMDRQPEFANLDNVNKAARTIYLNKTCFNGLYRVNKKGYFNSPIGRTASGKTPDIVQKDRILEMSEFLKTVQFHNGDYKKAVENAVSGDVIFFDPPYAQDEDIKSAGFVGYQKEGWSDDDLVDLKNLCDELVSKGCKVIVSNNDTTLVREVFKGYTIKEVDVRRSVNRDGNSRKGKEVIIYKI